MRKRHFIVTGIAVLLASAVGLRAQTTTGNVTLAAGEAKVTTEQIIGEVALVDGNRLVVKLQPKGRFPLLRHSTGAGVHRRWYNQAHRRPPAGNDSHGDGDHY